MNALSEISGYLVQTLLSLYLLTMVLRFVLQLVRADFYNPICQFLVKVTNPLVIPLRRVLLALAAWIWPPWCWPCCCNWRASLPCC